MKVQTGQYHLLDTCFDQQLVADVMDTSFHISSFQKNSFYETTKKIAWIS